MKGKKTYIVAFLMLVLTGAQAMGWITPDQYKAVEAALVALGLAALRAGVAATPGSPS